MTAPTSHEQVRYTSTFHDLVSMPLRGKVNAVCWHRELKGDFSEIAKMIVPTADLQLISAEQLLSLELSATGQQARETILYDLKLLTEHGASPSLNLISRYERDVTNPVFPTDVYSFHVDRAPVAADTFLCTYTGEPSEFLPNQQAIKKVLLPVHLEKLEILSQASGQDLNTFLSEHFYDLHYQEIPGARPVSLGNGHLWRLATENPASQVPPCIHRAPPDKNGESRLLLIC